MKKFKFAAILSVLAVMFASFAGDSAYAETAISAMTVSPQYQKIILVPGETFHGSVTVSNSNNSTSSLRYSASVGSFSQGHSNETNDDYGDVSFDSISSYNQIVNWITIDNETGIVEKNENRAITFTINVPSDAPAGGQYATILVKNDTGSGGAGEGINIQESFQFGSILYAEVAGNTVDTGEILNNEVPAFIFDGSTFKATSRVKNTGNVHTDAEYTLQVWPLFSGEEICTNEENPDKSLILPGTERYHAQSCKLPAFGIFNVKQVVKIFDKESVVERMVIVCPVWLMFIIIFGILLIIFYIIAKAKKRKND